MTRGILGKPDILSCDNSVKITSTLSSENLKENYYNTF